MRKVCDHSSWLSLCRHEGELALFETDRLARIIHQMRNPREQKPSLIVLLGNKVKSAALSELVSDKAVRRTTVRRNLGDLHLFVDAPSVFNDRPVLFADGDLHKPVTLNANVERHVEDCHDSTRRYLPKARNDIWQCHLDEVTGVLYSRLIWPFTDVFCFFAEDFGSSKSIVRHLASWLENAGPSTLPNATKPHIMIVLEENDGQKLTEQSFIRMLENETSRDISGCFSAISIVYLWAKDRASPQIRFMKLKESLMSASDEVRQDRMENQCLFSATHFSAFSRLACEHFSKTLEIPFDFIHSSRSQNGVSPNLERHLADFVKQFKSPEDLNSMAIPVVSSSLLLDNYTPEMHLFDGNAVFRTLYEEACLEVGRTAVLAHDGSMSLMLPSVFVKRIKGHFFEATMKLRQGQTATQIHRGNIGRFRMQWQRLHSNDTCLACLLQRPEYGLPCKHSLCKTCVQDYGQPAKRNPWMFKISGCPLCELEADFVAKVKHPNRGINALSIDGGGIRGIIPIQFLKLLQQRMKLPHAIQEIFDVAIGTSSGGLIILALFVNGWSIENCEGAFKSFACEAFQQRTFSCIPFLSLMKDSRYPEEGMEAALENLLGERRLTDWSHATATGTKIGLTATAIPGTRPYLFTNYNGVGARSQECSYRIVGPDEDGKHARFWEVARCISAAPWYFRPKRIDGIGTFQDGGLWQNNPVDIAHWETCAIWPMVNEPDLVLSLGTGFSDMLPDLPRSALLRWWRSSFIFRSFSAFQTKMSGNKIFREFLNRRKPDSGGKIFRFDHEFYGEEPSLDRTDKMQDVGDQARARFAISMDVDEVVRCLIAKFFHFELAYLPTREGRKRVCGGWILCDLKIGHPDFESLIDQLSACSAQFSVDGRPVPGRADDRSFKDHDGNFRKWVEFKVEDMKQNVAFQLRETPFQPQSISGSPVSVEKLVSNQGLDAPFGGPGLGKRRYGGDSDSPRHKRPCLTVFWQATHA